MKRSVACFLLATGVALAWSRPATAAEPLHYNRDIRPIFAENCIACHGPSSASRKADLRLDQRKAAIDAGAITPGKPDESEMIDRIFSDDPKHVMPPPESHKKLTAAQKETLRHWIAEGAVYEAHWSFIAPQRPPLPEVQNRDWARNPIDRFILARLEQEKLTPAAEADRRTIARRLSLDITGLPPEPADVEAFVSDTTPDAYEKLIGRWMARPQWGEHRARYWLDAARYADTNGLHFDNFREMWSYRDWVIGAFNRNLSFDRFTLEQLAGDLLPNRTLAQQIASGFNRCNITTNEGGTIPEENLVFYTRDRTETTSQVWLGLTANCAVCHDHKFDPMAQKDFYSLSAFFNNTTQGALDGNIKDSPPVVIVPRPEDRSRWSEIVRDLGAQRSKLAERKKVVPQDFEKWLAHADPVQCKATLPTKGLKLHMPLDEGNGAAGAPPQALHVAVDGKPRELPLTKPSAWEPGYVARQAWKVTAPCPVDVAEAGDFEKSQGWSVAAWVKLPPEKSPPGAVVARMDERNAYRGWDCWVEGRRIAMHIIHQWPDDALKAVTRDPIKGNNWIHLVATYNGSGRADGVKIYVDGKVQAMRPPLDKLKGPTIHTTVPLSLGRRHHGQRLDGLLVQDLRLYSRPLSPAEADALRHGTRAAWLAAKPTAGRTPAEKNDLFDFWLGHLDAPSVAIAAQVAALEKAEAAIKARGTVAHVMEEKTDPAKAYVLYRGEYDKRRDEVTPATPSWLPPMSPDLPRNRLGLAQWLLRPEHPLTARVAVNRSWQEVFGQGLVRTAGDFGSTGEQPTHPELLDWLAVEFRESGWDMQRLYRLIFTSATYRQAATVTPAKLEKDPLNKLLSRGARFRMDAEMVRDYALAASGLLVRQIGGPSVKPYQPDGVWDAVAMIGSNTRDYQRDAGENLYRRSMYTLWKRAAPPASMEVFNAPSREVCTVRRERTDTPLQALVTLNDPQFVEAARHLAQQAMKEAGSTDVDRIDFVARRLLARPLDADEIRVVLASLKNLLAYYIIHADDARALITVGESKPDVSLAPGQLAGWTMLVNEMMNLDEVLNK